MCRRWGCLGRRGGSFHPDRDSMKEPLLSNGADSHFCRCWQGLFLFAARRIKVNLGALRFSRVIRSTDTLRRDKSSGMLVAANGFQGGTYGKSPEVLSSAVVITLAPTSTTLGGYRRGSPFFRRIGSPCLEIARRVIACGGLMRIAAACGDRNPYGPS